MIFPKRVRIDGWKSLAGISSSSSMLKTNLDEFYSSRKRQCATATQRDNEPILYLLNTTTNTTLLHFLIVALHLSSALSLPVNDRPKCSGPLLHTPRGQI